MDQLKLLMDYTKFHIGMYITLCTGLIAVLKFLGDKAPGFNPFLLWTLGLFVVAGAAGGLVGSSIPYFRSFDDLMTAWLGPWDFKWITGRWCTHLEHSAFWLGILVAVIGVLNT